MSTIEMLSKEMEEEAKTTRKMLERIPNDRFNWQAHEKSMTIQRLSTHIAELPSWVGMALFTDELDFSKSTYQPSTINNTEELLELFEKKLDEGKESLAKGTEDLLPQKWVMRDGAHISYESTKGETVRMAFCQIVHHRAQLGVYLRLLNIPIPGSYGPVRMIAVFSLYPYIKKDKHESSRI